MMQAPRTLFRPSDWRNLPQVPGLLKQLFDRIQGFRHQIFAATGEGIWVKRVVDGQAELPERNVEHVTKLTQRIEVFDVLLTRLHALNIARVYWTSWPQGRQLGDGYATLKTKKSDYLPEVKLFAVHDGFFLHVSICPTYSILA